MKPKCCNKPATPYTKNYRADAWETGYRCKKCGRIRIPFIDQFDMTHMNAMEAVRLAGIAFDESLSGS